jgi:hypothetical protein
VAVRVANLAAKDAAIAAHPTAFFTIPHFDGYAAILIQLRKVTLRGLTAAPREGWEISVPIPSMGKRKRAR